MNITGANLIIKALKEEGVNTIFAYPGGQAIDMFDALYDEDEIQVILGRHEQALIHAADGYARSTGRVGVCMVTSGPGATNLVTGIANANYDSIPLVCLCGQVPTHLIGNDAFQEVDIVGISRSICKYAITVLKRDSLAEVLKKAFYIASTGKPGVVVVDIPKDIQQALGSDVYPKDIELKSYKPNVDVHIGQIKKAINALQHSKKPIVLVGGGVHISNAQKELLEFIERTNIPFVTTMMGKGALATTHELYFGNIGIHGTYAANKAIAECDFIFSIGTRFNDRITGKVQDFAKQATIVHIDIDPASISRNVQVDIPIVADAKYALTQCTQRVQYTCNASWINEVKQWNTKRMYKSTTTGLHAKDIIDTLNTIFETAIYTTDVGQNQLWATQLLELNENKRLITSGGLGTMGFGLPSAIGAKIGNPDIDVISINGDGGIQMNIQDLATAVVYELPIIICILNNGYLGNVRQWQELFYDKRYSYTCLRYRLSCKTRCHQPNSTCPTYTPDFIKLAQSYGAQAIRVSEVHEIAIAIEKARLQKHIPTVIEFIIQRESNVFPMVIPGKSIGHMMVEDDEVKG